MPDAELETVVAGLNDVTSGWTLEPRLGVTYARTTRADVAEGDNSPFALRPARGAHAGRSSPMAAFRLVAAITPDAAFRPFVALDARYQIEGRRVLALAGMPALGPD